MNKCTINNNWTTGLTRLSDAEFDELLDHAEDCRFHTDILNKYEADTLPYIKLAFVPDISFYNYRGTGVSNVPRQHQPAGRTIEEEMISHSIKEILKTGLTADNCKRSLELLNRNESVVRRSWSNTLNKARVLIGLGEKTEARTILDSVMKEYSGSRQAVGSVYEIRSWLEELEFNEGGKVDQRILDRRIDYINKGLEFYPENYVLWLNAFEAACLKQYVDKAIVCLREVEKIDNKIARQYFLDSPIKSELSRADARLKQEIVKLRPGFSMETV